MDDASPAPIPARPRRSALYLPASKARALEKARTLAADVLIFDLEDAVAPDEKESARSALASAIAEGGYAPRETVIRVNGQDTPWCDGDLAMVASSAADAVLLPKIESSAAVDAAARLLDGAGAANLPIWVMIETPLGTLNVAEIAAHPRVACLVLGTNDLLNDLRAVATPDRLPLLTALSLAVAAARAHGKVVLDGVYNAFRDEAGFEAEAAQGRLLGMEGKTLIHPLQIAIANRVYAPNPAAIERARADLAAFDAALARGEGIAVVDGRMVENLHAAAARRLIAEADAIARIETAASDAASV